MRPARTRKARRRTVFAPSRVIAVALALVALAGGAAAEASPPLAKRVGAILDAPEFHAVRWGVHAVALDTGELLVSRDADRRFTPASNLKLYTTATALAKLGPQYRWRTSVYAAAAPDRAGRVAGDLVIYGRGDPTISARFSGSDPLAKIERLASDIAAAGVRRVAGDLVADESYFKGARFGYGWEWNDLQWGYGAEVSALSVDDNVLAVEIVPGARAGEPCRISVTPASPYVRVVNRTRTSAKGGVSDLGIYRAEGSNVVDVWGHLPAGAETFTSELAVHDPAGLFATLLRSALERRKIAVAGSVRSVDAREREQRPFAVDRAVEIAHLESESLADVVHETNKESQNLYAELLLRTVGRAAGPPDAESAEAAGVSAVIDLLKSASVDTSALALEDGSGLSRGNYVTPSSTVGLLSYVRRQPFGDIFIASLPEAGVDGTLEKRFTNTAGSGRVRAKTGTLGDASALSGYLTTRSGRPVAFSIMVNNAPGDAKTLRRAIDAVVLELIDE
jgi:D-alanyl-D-alanine carboxypeptidase/D-alanyl-D-alanine-endopeptidase (penicillin-binding protein 4)